MTETERAVLYVLVTLGVIRFALFYVLVLKWAVAL
jgi:hypothetical protein